MGFAIAGLSDQQGKGSSLEFLPFSKLKQSVSPRVRNVLEALYQHSFKEFEAGIRRSLDEFERELFRQADKAGTNDAQTRLLDALKVFRKSNHQVLLASRTQHQLHFLKIFEYEEQSDANESTSFNRNSMTLVDPSILEVELATSELSARTEMRCSQVLQNLAVRYSVVSGGVPLPTDLVPSGPHQLMAALNHGLAELEIPTKLKVEFFRCFEKLHLLRMPEILDAHTLLMMELRVLPNLNLGIANTKRDEKPEEKPESKAEEKPEEKPEDKSLVQESSSSATRGRTESESSSSATRDRTIQESPTPRATPTNRADLPSAQPRDRYSAATEQLDAIARDQHASTDRQNAAREPNLASPPPSASQAASQGGLAARTAARASQAQAAAEASGASKPYTVASQSAGDVDAELFSTLRELLAGKRANIGEPDASQSDARMVRRDDVESVLTVLQQQNPAPVMVGGKWRTRRVQDIKQDLLAQLRNMNGGKPAQLPQEDSDTIDLVGMLFDHVLQDTRTSQSAQSLLGKLQVPIIKVALRDKGFFARRNHPARHLLNSVAETSLFWMDGSDGDPALMERMQLVVDRVVSEADDDEQVFEQTLGDLGRHVETIQRKADVAERRNVEAARGKERLEVARKAANEVINDATRGRLLPGLVTQLLEGAWADLLALTRLRESVDSDVYVERVDAANQLARCFDIDNPVPKSEFLEIRPVLEEGMGLVGFHPPEITRTLNAVSELVVEGEALIPSLEPKEEMEVTKLVASKARPSEEEGEKQPQSEKQSILAHLRKDEKLQLTPKEQQTLERLKQLPFGTWFEFAVNQQGDIARRKLSWFSPVTSRCLFVNARGAKVEERSMEQLARDLVRGNVKVWEPQKESMIDRAWRSIKDTLKGWSGSNKSLDELLQTGGTP